VILKITPERMIKAKTIGIATNRHVIDATGSLEMTIRRSLRCVDIGRLEYFQCDQGHVHKRMGYCAI